MERSTGGVLARLHDAVRSDPINRSWRIVFKVVYFRLYDLFSPALVSYLLNKENAVVFYLGLSVTIATAGALHRPGGVSGYARAWYRSVS